MNTNTIKKVLKELEKNPQVEKKGIHIHRKTQNFSEWDLDLEFEEIFQKEDLKLIDIINIGGGLPCIYKNQKDISIKNIFSKIKKFKKFCDKNKISLIIEPGRFIAASSCKLVSHIILIEKNTCFLDVSIFNGTLDTIIANVKLPVLNEKKLGKKFLLKGITPDSCDILRYSIYLKNVKVGDKIIFENCGAYTYTTNFCALEKIKEKIILDF